MYANMYMYVAIQDNIKTCSILKRNKIMTM